MLASIIDPLKRFVWSAFRPLDRLGQQHQDSNQLPMETSIVDQVRDSEDEKMAQLDRIGEMLDGGGESPSHKPPAITASKRRVRGHHGISRKRRRVRTNQVADGHEDDGPVGGHEESPGLGRTSIHEDPEKSETQEDDQELCRDGDTTTSSTAGRGRRSFMVGVVVVKNHRPSYDRKEHRRETPKENKKREEASDSIEKPKLSSEKRTTTGIEETNEAPTRHVRFEDDQVRLESHSDLLQPHTKHIPTREASTTKIRQVGTEDAASDDGDAPEMVAASVAQREVTTGKRNAVRAIQSQAATVRQQRRDRDQRFKAQSKTRRGEKETEKRISLTSEGRTEMVASSSTSMDPHHQKDDAPGEIVRTSTAKFVLPDFLPEEILAAEPYRRPPPEPRQVKVNRPQPSNKHVVFTHEEKPPKDVRRGPVKVRVLEKRNPVLPPRAAKAAKSLREDWLTGRSKKGGAAAVERRQMRTSFVKHPVI